MCNESTQICVNTKSAKNAENSPQKDKKHRDPKHKLSIRKAEDNQLKGQMANIPSPLKERFIKSGICCNEFEVKDEKMRPLWTCQCHWCKCCNAKRALVRFKAYSKELLNVFTNKGGLQHTVLTQKNVYGEPGHTEEIEAAAKKLYESFIKFKNNFQKKHKKTFISLYHLEIEPTDTGGFHVHVHILHQTIEIYQYKGIDTNDIIMTWLKHNPTSNIYGQFTKPIKAEKNNIDKAIAEITKYVSKSTTEFDTKNNKTEEIVPVKQLVTIYCAISKYTDENGNIHKPIRTFIASGLKKNLTKKEEDEEMKNLKANEIQKPNGKYKFNKNTWTWEMKEYFDKEGTQIVITDKNIILKSRKIKHTITHKLWNFTIPQWMKERYEKRQRNKGLKQYEINCYRKRKIAEHYSNLQPT